MTNRGKEGAIKDFIAGEDLPIFNKKVLALPETVPELRATRTWTN